MKAVIFDMDGVIFDSERLYIECCTEVADELGMDGIVEVCYRCIGVTAETTRQILLEAYRDPALVDRFREKTVSMYLEKYDAGLLAVKPGVKELLQFLKDRGCRTAIASSTRTDVVKKELSEAGLLGFFERVVGGDRVSRSKPNPDIFLKAAEELGAEPEHCLVIEDSFNGIRAAKAAGMTAVMVPDLLQPDREMTALADVIEPSLLCLLDRLRRKTEHEA